MYINLKNNIDFQTSFYLIYNLMQVKLMKIQYIILEGKETHTQKFEIRSINK